MSDNEQGKRETLADIVAEIRAYGAQPPPRLMWLEIADRIEAAWTRERDEIEAQALSIGGIVEASRHTPGNSAAMRDEVVLRLSKEEYKGMQEALSEHDRLCEMLSESRKSVGDAAAMREALITIRQQLQTLDEYGNIAKEAYLTILGWIDAALSAPPRQCDVGTAEEQSERMEKAVCSKHHGCVRCPLRKAKYSDCSLGWAQTPYEAQEGEE